MTKRYLLVVLACAVALCGASAGQAQETNVIYVDASAESDNGGTSWQDAYPDLRSALSDATGGGADTEIWIAEGTYTPATAQDPFSISGEQDGLALYGGFEGTEAVRSERAPQEHVTVLSGDVDGNDTNKTAAGVTPRASDIEGTNSVHVFVLDGTSNGAVTAETVIDGVVVTAGQADGEPAEEEGRGGGLFCDGADGGTCNPTIRNVRFAGNTAGQGGAIYNLGDSGTSSPTIVNAIFSGNEAATGEPGGAMLNDGRSRGASSPTIANVVFTNNTADQGGAIYNIGIFGGTSSPTITGVTFTGNTAETDGGALYNLGNGGTSSPTITNTILWTNGAPNGAEMCNGQASPVLSHTIVEGGTSGIEGGGTTFVDDEGNDVSFANSTNFDRNPQFHGEGTLSGDDGRIPTVDDSLNLTYGSPALDAGANDSVSVSADVTGADRILDVDGDGAAIVNLGAYELPAPAPPTIRDGAVVSLTGAAVTGRVNPRGTATAVQFRLYPAGRPDQDTLLSSGTVTGTGGRLVGATVRSLAPATTYEVEVQAENAEGRTRSDPIAFETPAPELTRGEGDQSVAVRLTAGSGGDEQVAVYAREGGSDSYQAIATSREGEQRFEATVPGSLITPRGVDYYVTRTDGADTRTLPTGGPRIAQSSPLHLPVQVDTLSPPSSVTAAAGGVYQMLSIPAMTDGKAGLEGTYGPYNPVSWRALRWDGTAQQYREFPVLETADFRPGRAFWLVSRNGTRPSFAEGRTVDASTPKTIELAPGWNQIGTPFGFSVPWDTVEAASGLEESILDGPFAYRDGDYVTASTLDPWVGYFVFNTTTDPQRITIPPVGGASSASTQSAALGTAGAVDAKQGEAYTLRGTARTEAGAQSVWMGVRPEARENRDPLDVAQPPPAHSSVRLSVLETVGRRTVPHMGSFKPLEEAGQTWRLRLSNGTASTATVRLELSATGTLPEGMERSVVDPSAERYVAPGDEFEVEKGEGKELMVLVGTERYVERHTEDTAIRGYKDELRGNTPNPFEDATTIAYTLSEEQAVTLTVYDALGRRLRTLVDARKQAGLHQVRWEGTDRYGTPVGNGVYFIRMRAGQTQQTQKVVRVQ